MSIPISIWTWSRPLRVHLTRANVGGIRVWHPFPHLCPTYDLRAAMMRSMSMCSDTRRTAQSMRTLSSGVIL